MIMHSYKALVGVAVVLFTTTPALAQNCTFNEEAIVNLRAPIAGSYNVWDTVHGDIEHTERFYDALALDDGNILMVGDRETAEENTTAPFLVMVGRNGRVLWEKPLGIPGYKNLVKFESHPRGALVMANIHEGKRDKIWLGAFKVDGERLWRTTLQAPDGKHLYGHDVEHSPKDSSFVISMTRADKHEGGDPLTTMLYRINESGRTIKSRAFAIGADNTIEDIEVLADGSILGAGWANNAIGRRDGWMMRVTPDFILNWQAPYARGAAAELSGVAVLGKDQEYAAAVGTALPRQEGNRAGWVLVVEAAGGDVAWQRYFSGDLHFEGRDILTNKDGIISAILDGKTPDDSAEVEHIRLLALNPRGDLLSSEEFFNGEGVDAVRLFEAPTRNRVIIGSSRILHKVGLHQDGDDAETKVTIDAWAVAAPSAPAYVDPCIPKVRKLD
jgi:hypothetical protein